MSGIKNIEDVHGMTDYDMPWKKEEADFFLECDRRVMGQNKAELNIIEPQLQANGRQAWLDTSKIPLHDEQGKVIGIVAIIEDITEENEAKDEQKRLLTILSATPDVVGIADSGRLRSCTSLDKPSQAMSEYESQTQTGLRYQRYFGDS